MVSSCRESGYNKRISGGLPEATQGIKRISGRLNAVGVREDHINHFLSEYLASRPRNNE